MGGFAFSWRGLEVESDGEVFVVWYLLIGLLLLKTAREEICEKRFWYDKLWA